MKMRKLSMMMLMLAIVGRASADNLTVSDFAIDANETKAITIDLANPERKYAAFQFDLVLPEGITIALNKKNKLIASLDEDRIDDHTLTVDNVGNNTYRFLTISMTNAEFYEESGALVHVTLQADANIVGGKKTATIKSQVFTEASGDQHKWSDLTFNITNPIAVSSLDITVGKAEDGEVPELIVKYGDATLIEGEDYAVSYCDDADNEVTEEYMKAHPDSYKAVITLQGIYSGRFTQPISVSFVTGINEIVTECKYGVGNGYTINGQKIGKVPPTKGIYIINRKKIVMN